MSNVQQRNILFRLLCIILVSVLLQTHLQEYVYASETQTSAATKPTLFKISTLPSVKLLTKSSIQIQNLQMQRKGSEKYIYFEFVINNGENKPLSTLDYWVRVMSKNGNKFTVSSINKDDKNNTVQPNSKKVIPMMAKVNYQLNLGELRFSIVKWDFSVTDYQRTLGTIAVPSSFNNVIPMGKYGVINYQDNSLKTYTGDVSAYLIGEEREVSVNFIFENAGLQTIELPKLNYYIRTGDGNIYKMDPEVNTEGIKLIPKQSKKIRSNVTIPSEDTVKSIQLYSTIDDAKNAVEYPLSYYGLNINETSNAAKYGETKDIYISEQKIATKVRQVFNDNGENEQGVQIQFQMINADKTSVKFPDISFALVTQEGTSYPMEIVNKPTELNPKIVKEFTVEGQISAEDASKPYYLAIKTAITDVNKQSHILALYSMPANMNANTQSNNIIYENPEGRFQVKVVGLQRIPWNNQDMLNVYVDITNIGSQATARPNITASLELDGYKINETNIQSIPLTGAVTIGKGSKASFALSSKIPYSTKYQSANIVLFEKKANGSLSTIGKFSVPTTLSLPSTSYGQTYSIDSEGRKSEYSIVKYSVYSGTDYDVAVAELSFKNNEMRFSTLPLISAYFTNASGYLTNATVIQDTKGVGPSEKNLMKLYAKFPKKMPLNDLQLFVGEAVSNGQYASGTQVPDAMVNLVKVNLPQENKTIAKELPTTFTIEPYKITFNKVNTVINGSTNMKLYLNYNLTEQGVYNVVTKDHKLAFEVVTTEGSFDSKLDLDLDKGQLKEGSNIDQFIEFNDSRVGALAFSGYTLNVYDEFEGAKKLLVSIFINNYNISN